MDKRLDEFAGPHAFRGRPAMHEEPTTVIIQVGAGVPDSVKN
jgi:hypothetical protein